MIKAIIILSAICLFLLVLTIFFISLLTKSNKQKKELYSQLDSIKSITKELSNLDLKVKEDEKKINQGSVAMQFNTALEQLQNLSH